MSKGDDSLESDLCLPQSAVLQWNPCEQRFGGKPHFHYLNPKIIENLNPGWPNTEILCPRPKARTSVNPKLETQNSQPETRNLQAADTQTLKLKTGMQGRHPR